MGGAEGIGEGGGDVDALAKDDIVHRLKIRFIRRTRYLTFCLWITSYVYSEDLKYCLTNVS